MRSGNQEETARPAMSNDRTNRLLTDAPRQVREPRSRLHFCGTRSATLLVDDQDLAAGCIFSQLVHSSVLRRRLSTTGRLEPVVRIGEDKMRFSKAPCGIGAPCTTLVRIRYQIAKVDRIFWQGAAAFDRPD
jgi:hypothetical protein